MSNKHILVISHNVFSDTTNMGKTLCSYFSDFKADELAQFYIHSEVPTSNICKNYYRITDREAIKSIVTRKSGRVFTEKDIEPDRLSSRTDSGNEAAIYQKSRKRTPLIYFARNLWWGLSSWNTKQFKKWVDEFNPDIIFFASGDYAFIYKIALKIAMARKIPLVVSCMDDYYFNNKNKDALGGKFIHRLFMKQVKKTMAYTSCILSICEKMSNEYSEFFGKKSYVLHTPATFDKPLEGKRENKISYLGNLGYKRNEQLIALGKALKSCEGGPEFLDVYSSESREEILKDFTNDNGINFHGAVSAEAVKEIMAQSKYLVHTEAFNDKTRTAVRYSVSTKIADSLMSGSCLTAFGPSEIASISYLKENNAAFVITENDDITDSLNKLFASDDISEQIKQNAVNLAIKNHNPNKNAKFVRETLTEIINENSAS